LKKGSRKRKPTVAQRKKSAAAWNRAAKDAKKALAKFNKIKHREEKKLGYKHSRPIRLTNQPRV